ncbi:hypothetical protein, partial [Gardnerella vaginalis]
MKLVDQAAKELAVRSRGT